MLALGRDDQGRGPYWVALLGTAPQMHAAIAEGLTDPAIVHDPSGNPIETTYAPITAIITITATSDDPPSPARGATQTP